MELDFEAILNFSPLPKVVISIPDRGVIRLLSLINISSKRPAPTSAGSPSTHLYTLTGAGYKKDFNKGVLLVTHIEPY